MSSFSLRHWFRRPPPAAFDLDLPNGLALQLAVVRPDHAPRFAAGYEQLSEQSRRQRFFGQISSLSSTQLEFLTRPDGRNHLAYAALDRSRPNDPGVGVARAIRLDADSAIAEVALTVLDAYQHRGAGGALHAAVHVHAAAVGIEQLLYDLSPDNERFAAHLLALGAVRVQQDKDLVRLRLPVCGKPEQVPGKSPAALRLAALIAAVRSARPAPVPFA